MRQRNLMLGILITVLAFGFILLGPSNTIAEPIFLADVISSGSANVDITGLYSGNVHTDYALDTNLWGLIDAFCVEDEWASGGWEEYELLPVPSELYQAAWIADQYWNSGTWIYNAEDTQIAIWEAVLGDIFTYNYGANEADINTILAMTWSTPSINVSLAHNPVGDAKDYQDYLVNQPIPEPATMLLVGSGLIGLAGLGRKKFRRVKRM